MKRLIATLVLVGLPLTATAQNKIPVFVKAVQAAEGFTDPDKSHTDSVKDVIKSLKDSKVVQLVTSGDDAAIVLEVLDRDMVVSRGLFKPQFSQTHTAVTVRIVVGTFSADFTGTSGGALNAYGRAAGNAVDKFEKWVKENRAKLSTTPTAVTSTRAE